MSPHTPARVQPGTPTGGQFATEAKSEADVTLGAATPQAAHRAKLAELRTMLAEHLDIDEADVTESLDSQPGCGRAQGAARIRVEAKVLDDELGTEVTVACEVAADGTPIETFVEVSFDIPHTEGAEYTRDSVSVATGYARAGEATEEVPRLIEQARAKARLQRAADALINTPQRERDIADGFGRSFLQIVEVRVLHAGPQPVLEVADATLSDRPAVQFTLDPATGRATGGQMRTKFGNMTLGGENLRRAQAEAYRTICIGLRQYDKIDKTSPDDWPDKLTEHFAKIVAA